MNKCCIWGYLLGSCILTACATRPQIPESTPAQAMPLEAPQPQAQAKNRQQLSALQAALTTCVHIDITHITIGDSSHTHHCTAAETQEVLALLGELHALPFEGSILAQPGQWYVLTFYDAGNNKLASVRNWEITHEKAATHPTIAQAKATMYLPATHYARFEQILQKTSN